MRKILPQAYVDYSEDKILSITQISGKLAICEWALIDFVSEFTRTLKGHDPTLVQDQVLAGRRVASAPGPFGFDAKFPKPRNEEVFTLRQTTLDDFKQ